MRTKHSGFTEMKEEDKVCYHNLTFFKEAAEIISDVLKIEISTLDQLVVLQDILARTYLNALDDRGLSVDLVPFFYLYLPHKLEVGKDMSGCTSVELSRAIDEYTYDYVKAFFVMSIERLREELNNFTKVYKRYKETTLINNEDVDWVTQYLENKLVREKPDWWMLLENSRIRIEVTEPLLIETLGPSIGDVLIIYRPYSIRSRRNRWDIEKEPIFVSGGIAVKGPFYFDYAKIKVSRKTVGINGAVSVVARDVRGDTFICDIQPDTPPENVLCKWRVLVNPSIMGESYREPQVFIALKDFKRLNEECGGPLSEYKLKTLIEDASVKTIHLEV